MTFKDLHLAVFRREPTNGRVLWQPRIEHWYETNKAQGTLPERYRDLSLLEVFDDLGCSVRPYWAFNDCLRIEDSEELVRHEVEEGPLTTITEKTPVGSLVTVMERTSQSWHTRRYPVVTPADMKVMEWRLRNRRIWFDRSLFEERCTEIGDRAASCVFISRINLLRLVIEFMGFEGGLTAFYTMPAEVESLICTINETDDALLDVVCDTPLEIINFGDNVHQAFCPPNLFKKWVLPEYIRRNERLHVAGKRTYPHWDGDCAQLLPYAQDCGFDGFEAITPVPQGDVTLEQVRDALGDRIMLDGIPCTDFLRTESIDSLVTNTRKCIEYFAPNLVLGISDEISPVGDIERVRLVSEIVAEYGSQQR